MTSPPSPAFSEVLSSCCSSADEGLDCAPSEASSPELKRVKRQNMKTKLEDIFCSRLHTGLPTRSRLEDASTSVEKYTSKMSFVSADNDRCDVFKKCTPPAGLGNSQNLCCSLPDMNLDASNECKGLDTDCSCCFHSDSEPTEISLDLRTDRKEKVVSSYYSHFKQIHSTPLLPNGESNVESDDEGLVKEKEPITVNNTGADGTSDMYWRDNKALSGMQDSVVVVLDDDEPFAPISPRTCETGVVTDNALVPNTVAIDAGNQYDKDIIDMPDQLKMGDDVYTDGVEIVSIDNSLPGNENDGVEHFIEHLPPQNSPRIIGRNDRIEGAGHEFGSMNLSTPAGETTANNRALIHIGPVDDNSKLSPAGESFFLNSKKTENVYENSSTENLDSEILENSKLENSLEISQDSKNDSVLLRSRRIEKEFKSELEFSTVLTLAYVRVRDLTNNIDKAQEFLTKLDKNDDQDDINELRYKIQAMFDSRATLSLEHAKWRSQFTSHFHQRRKVLATLKSRACRTEQTYFQLRKELLDLEKEPIIPKRKRSLFSKIFSFRFVK